MGSVTRRIRRNIIAKGMAVNAGIVPPVVVYRDPDGNEAKRVFLRSVPIIVYRSIMLRVKAMHTKSRKHRHHAEQVKSALKKKRVEKVRNEGSMLKRAFNRIFRRTGQ